MTTLHFAITIRAPKKAVWDAMIGPDTYRIWASEFSDGSYFEGSWDEGQRILFLAPNGDGMTAVIAENRPYEFISIKHLGYIKYGVEDTDSEQVRSWAPLFENYTFVDLGPDTEVRVDMDVTPDFESCMAAIWPKALARIKELCEPGSWYTDFAAAGTRRPDRRRGTRALNAGSYSR